MEHAIFSGPDVLEDEDEYGRQDPQYAKQQDRKIWRGISPVHPFENQEGKCENRTQDDW